MPLFAHWRHPSFSSAFSSSFSFSPDNKAPEVVEEEQDNDDGGGIAPTASDVGRGDPSSSSSSGRGVRGAAPIFCAFDARIEARLRALHERKQRLVVGGGDEEVQLEIDRYLVACLAPGLRHLVLPRNNVPHYDNLPDISAYAIGILDPSMDSDPELQQVLLLLRQCTPLRRRTKRAQREVQWREESLFPMQTLVRCMQVGSPPP